METPRWGVSTYPQCSCKILRAARPHPGCGTPGETSQVFAKQTCEGLCLTPACGTPSPKGGALKGAALREFNAPPFAYQILWGKSWEHVGDYGVSVCSEMKRL